MIKIVDNGEAKKKEKRYSVATVAKAIGGSEGAINAYFSNRKITTKGGITIAQIAEVVRREKRVRKSCVKWEEIAEIREALEREHGITITEVDDAEDSQIALKL